MDLPKLPTLGEVRVEFRGKSTARFEWTIPDCSKLRPGYFSSPAVKYFKVKWYLEILAGCHDVITVFLRRKLLTSGIPESVKYTIGWKRSETEEGNIARDETLSKDYTGWTAKIPGLSGPSSQRRLTFTCTLRRNPHARGPLSGHAPKIPVDRPTRQLDRTPADAACSINRANFPTLGEVREEFRGESTARFEWTIPDCSKLRPGYFSSPAVKYFEVKWYLEILAGCHDVITVFLRREHLTSGIPESVHYTIGWKTADGEEGNIARDETLSKDYTGWTAKIPGLSGPYSQRRLTFTCTLRRNPHARGVSRETETEGASCSNGRKDEHASPGSKGVSRETQTEDTGFKGVSRETQTEEAHGRNDEHPLEDISILRENFKNLLLSGDGHDVLLKVGDKQFRAHKNILKVRSPVFEAMFTNDMAESAEGSVTIEDCDADAFGEFLHYVYTGEVDFSSASSALALYYAGDKYDLPRLKKICVHFLKISFTINSVFHVIHLAAIHGEEELMQQAIVFFANNLEEVMITAEWQRFLLANPIIANEINLKAVQCRLKTSLHKK